MDTSDKSKSESFENAARPLIKWLNENSHPHTSAIVTQTGAELLEGIMTTGDIMDYVKG